MDAWNHLDAAAQLTHNDSSQTPAARWVDTSHTNWEPR